MITYASTDRFWLILYREETINTSYAEGDSYYKTHNGNDISFKNLRKITIPPILIKY